MISNFVIKTIIIRFTNIPMQQKAQQTKQPSKTKPPFLLKFSTQQKPRRILSLNRLNYPQNLQKDGTFVAKKDIIEHELFDHHIVQTNMKIQGELKKLQILFIHEKVPEFYAYYFMNRLAVASEQKIEDKIIKQLEEVKAKRSFFHVIMNAIKARQGCLKQLQRCLDNLFNNQEDNLTKHVFREEITHYRKLTGFVISHIRAWKQSLNYISPQVDFTTFLYQGQDYLIKLLNDCQFIFNSFLSRHLKFSYRNDPYIMRPYVEIRQSKYYDLFKFDDEEKGNYMIDLNYLAGERAKYLESKMNSKNEKMKEIERIYHYRDVPLTSRIIIRKMPNLSADKRDDKEHKPELIVDNFMSTNNGNQNEKKLKLAELSKKSQKIKKIKEIFGKTSQSNNRIINENMFETIGGSESKTFLSPYQQKLKYTQYHQKKGNFHNLNYESDFQNLLRKKELDVLRGGNMDATKTQRSFKNLKLKDSLSDSRKFITNQEGFSELEKILNQLDTFSPQKLDNYKYKKKEDPSSSTLIKFNEGKTAKSRIIEPQKTLLEHNEEVYVTVRNQVIQQIENGLREKAKFEEKQKEENQKIQNILQKKINDQSLRIIKNSRVKQLQGRQELAKEMQSPQIFGYDQSRVKNSEKLSQLEEELKKQMQLKWLRQVQEQLKRKTELNELEKIKAKEQKELNKKLEKVAEKQQLERRYQQIERQQKAKAMQKMIQLDQNRKKQIQEQMKVIIEKEKESMEKFAALQRTEVQKQLREAMKAQMLANIRNENQRFYDNAKKQQEKVKKESEFREQARSKIEQEYKVGQQMKKNREREQKLAKIRLVKQKLGQVGSPSKTGEGDKKIDKVIADNLDQKKQEEEMKQIKSRVSQLPDFRESLFPKYQRNSQADKKKLRQQFELELFAFRKPQTYEEKPDEAKMVYQQGKFPIKDFRSMIDKDMVEHQKIIAQTKQKAKEKQEEQIQQIQLFKPEQKDQILQGNKIKQDQVSQRGKTSKSQVNSDRFTKFSKQTQNKQQKQRERGNEQDELIRMKLGMTHQEYQIYKKKKNAISIKRDIQGEYQRKRAQEQKKEVVKVIDQFQKMDSLIGKQQTIKNMEQFPDSLSVVKQDLKQIKQQDFESIDEDQNVKRDQRRQKEEQKQDVRRPMEKPKNKEVQILTINSRITSKVNKRFQTSDSQEEKEKKRVKNKRKPSKKKKKDASQHQEVQQNVAKQELKIQQVPKALVTVVKKRQIPVTSLSEFFNDHFEHLPKVIKKINIYKKEELIKFLLQHSSFTMLEYIKDSISIGFGVVLFNENKSKYRSLNIVHLGSYDENDYLQVLLNITRHCFKNDPCEEITMSNIYDKQISEQWEFVKAFEKKFDPYGAIFQKKIFNTQFERKFVLRRNIGEVCKVQPIAKFNRGAFQLEIHNFITQSQNQQQTRTITEADQYDEINYNVGFYGILAHYISQKYSQEALAYLISRSTSKDSSMLEKSVASLAKLSMAMKKNQSFQRLGQLTQHTFDNIMNLNLQLLAKHEPVIAYPPEQIQRPLHCIWMAYNAGIHLSYDFYSQTIPITIHENKEEDGDEYLCKYLRYTPNKKNKMFTLKSSAYSSKITVLPCKENKYKIFVLDPQQYEGILGKSNGDEDRLDLGVYLRVFFANIVEHELADYDHIWMPETNAQLNKNQFSNLDAFCQAEVKAKQLEGADSSHPSYSSGILRSSLNFTYADYLGNSLKVQPSHRDLVVTPPFIMGVLNMQIETALEGSPIFVQKIGKAHMSWIREVEKVKKDSD